MICGALQTLNEEAFEDVVASERPSPTGGPSTGETIALTPIQETAELDRSLANLNDGTVDRPQLHTIHLSNTNNNGLNSNSISHHNNNNNNHISNSSNTNNNSDDSSHNFSLSNFNKGNSSSNDNCMVVATGKQSNRSDALNDDSHSEIINMSGLNVHEPSQSQTHLQCTEINPKITTTLMHEHESNHRNASNSNCTVISITPPLSSQPSSQSSSTVVSMPDTKITNNFNKTAIHDTHL